MEGETTMNFAGRTLQAVALCVLASGAVPADAATRYVDVRTCPAEGSGTQASPYCEIQTAVDLSFAGDVVKVAAGTYTTKHTRAISGDVPVFPNPATAVLFMKDQVHVEGAGAGVSVLDAGGSDRVVIFDRVGAVTRFQGFTVTGGDTRERVGDGAGMLVLLSSPLIKNNHIVGNNAFYGGGISVLFSSPTIEGNRIEGNTAGNDIQSSTGGGIDVAFASNPILAGNFIVGNHVQGSGAGLAFYETDGAVDANRIEGNVANLNGGGVFSAPTANKTRGTVTLRSNVISLNVARQGHGGGIFAAEGTTVTLSTISHNRAVFGDGGGIYVLGPQFVDFRENLIFSNGAEQGGGVYFDPLSNPQFSGNDTYLNKPTNFGGSIDPSGTQGNFSADPLLRNVPDFVADVEIDRFYNLVTAEDSEPTRQFALGDVVEYGDDGVLRRITEIKTAVGVPVIKLVTSPLLSEAELHLYPTALRHWGVNVDLKEDFGTEVLSPLIDLGSAVGASTTDAKGRARQFDSDLNGLTRPDIGALENLAELPWLALAAGGRLSWPVFSGKPWHTHLYRGRVAGLVDANRDGVPEGPDRVAGTADDGFGDCLVPGVELFGGEYVDAQNPAVGQAFFYLGTLMDATEGTLGEDSAGRLRPNLRPCD